MTSRRSLKRRLDDLAEQLAGDADPEPATLEVTIRDCVVPTDWDSVDGTEEIEDETWTVEIPVQDQEDGP